MRINWIINVKHSEKSLTCSKYSGVWFCSKAFACNAGDTGSIPELGRSPGEANGNPLQYSCLGNPMDRRA